MVTNLYPKKKWNWKFLNILKKSGTIKKDVTSTLNCKTIEEFNNQNKISGLT